MKILKIDAGANPNGNSRVLTEDLRKPLLLPQSHR